MEEQLSNTFTKLTTFLIGDNVFTGNTATGEWRRCSVAEYNANVANITPSGATPDLTDGIFTFDATTKAWSKVTINEFITNLNNKTTVNASPDISDSMLVIDSATNGLERLTIQEFLTRLGTTVTENTTPSLTDGIYVFDGSTKTLERLTINQLLTSVATNATENTTPDLADGIFVFDATTKAWERLNINEFFINLGTKTTENTAPDLSDGIYIFDGSTKALERLSLTQLFTRLGLNVTIGSGTTFADPIIVDDTTDSTSPTTGSIQTDGGFGAVKDAFFGNDATFGSGTTGSISVTVEDQSIADDEFREFRASATHNSNTTTSAIGVRTHSGLTNGVSYLFMRAEDQANSWVWFDNSNDMRRSVNVTDLGTTNGTVIGTQTSDERFKDNLRSLGYGLSEILALPTYKYERNGVTEIGFGAQSTINIIPEAVYDTGEEVEGENQSKYAMDYSRIVPVLVEAIKELKAEIDALKG